MPTHIKETGEKEDSGHSFLLSPSVVRITAGGWAPGLAATPLLPEEVQTVRGAPHCEHPTSHTNQAPLCPRAVKPTPDTPPWGDDSPRRRSHLG